MRQINANFKATGFDFDFLQPCSHYSNKHMLFVSLFPMSVLVVELPQLPLIKPAGENPPFKKYPVGHDFDT